MMADNTRSRLYSTLALLGIMALFIDLLSAFYVPAYEGIDEEGYLGAARRLAVHGDPAKRTADAYEYVNEIVVQVGQNLFYSKYPIGYPALGALAYRLGGPDAAFLVNPVLAALAVAGMFLLGRAMFGDVVGAFAAILLAMNPMHVYYALSAESHSSAVCFAVWGMYFTWQWAEHGGPVNAALAGLLSAYAITIRYLEALLILPVCAMVVWRGVELWHTATAEQRRAVGRKNSREVLVMTAAMVATITPLLAYHSVAFGAPWRTGYALCGEDTAFSWQWLHAHWALMLTQLDTNGLFLIFPVGVAGMFSLIGQRPKRGAFLTTWAVPYIILSTAYYWVPRGDGPWYVRYFLTVFPALILGALGVLCPPGRSRPWGNIAVGAFVVLVTTWSLQPSELPAMLEIRREQLLRDRTMMDRVREKVPPGSVILAVDHTLRTLEYAGDYRLYSAQAFTRAWIDQLLQGVDDNAPHPLQREKALELKRAFGDRTDAQLAELRRQVLADHLAAGRAVVVVCTKNDFGMWRAWLGDRFVWKPVAQWMEVRTMAVTGPLPKPQYITWCLYSL
jgi:4-amino-4-deoxy-L-arabinose transferase-like glycosyltransferase